MMKFKLAMTVLLLAPALQINAQKAKAYDLQQLLKEQKLTHVAPKPGPVSFDGKQGISFTGQVWLNGADFSTGTIDLDLHGQDVFQGSFIGITFHGADSATFDVVYFRPFNFQAEDPARRVHAVQYMSLPDFPWSRLRQEQHDIYEKAVNPAPKATDWFHAKIEVGTEDITVYVNHSATPSLAVKKLNTRKSGRIGLWNEGLAGQFANLTITTR
jgi:hypothetical protein